MVSDAHLSVEATLGLVPCPKTLPHLDWVNSVAELVAYDIGKNRN